VHLTVSDLGRALVFYRETLGFAVLRETRDSADLGVGSRRLVSLAYRPGAVRKPPHTTGLYHFAVLLPSRADLARAVQRLIETRYPIEGASDHLVSEALYLADPDGNGIEIYADRPRSAWPYRNGRLQMATLALDLQGLMGELASEPRSWESLPDGTRIGHIHLHVADLRAAEAFYRDVLGFDLMLHYGVSASFLSAGGYHHHIGLNTWAGVGAPAPPASAVGLRWFTVAVPDEAAVESIRRRAQTAGVPIEEQSEGMALRDPSGNKMLVTVASTE
jgi:catechol 2,3-dioxygenase